MERSAFSTSLRSLMTTGALVVLSLSAGMACAADPSSASRTVRFADLNLSKPSDAHALYMRILAAAQVACSHYWFQTEADKAACVRHALADAVGRIDQPDLSSVYAAKNKAPAPGSLVSQSR
jgi:UrcA family protein